MKKIDFERYKKRMISSTITVLLFSFISFMNNYFFLPEADKSRLIGNMPVMVIFILAFMAIFWYLIGIRESQEK